MPGRHAGALLAGSGGEADASSVLEVLRADYIRTARAKGMREAIVLFRHVLKNAAIPIVTIVGLQMSGLIGGAIVVETIFAWPASGG